MMASNPAPVAWVTGASSGIGREVALQLAADGWEVAVSARSGERLEALAGEAGERVHPFAVDVTDAPAVHATRSAIEQALGPITLALFNAGTYTPMSIDEFDADSLQRHMAVNFQGTVHGIAALLPEMRARRRGEILINASVAGYRGLPKALAYGPSKAALINLAEALRVELHGSGVTARVVNPGFVRTPLTDQNEFRMPALMEPEDAAARIVREIGKPGFEITFPKRFTYALKLMRCLPYAWYFPLLRRALGG